MTTTSAPADPARPPAAATNPYSAGAAYIDGRFMPIGEAAIPITDWGYRRSDVTYDVVGVWEGSFFRLDDHIARFRASMRKFRFAPQGERRRHPGRAATAAWR